MKGASILIVDDREVDRILYKEYLGEDDYIFQELEDGKYVLDFLNETDLDLILLDWQMPQMGGIDVLKQLKNDPRYEELPIIVITGLEDKAVLKEAFTFGSVDFLNKPVDSTELHARVNSAIKLYKANRQLKKQKTELQDLNDIIKQQKLELEKSLALKTELMDLKEEQHFQAMNEANLRRIAIQLNSSKVEKMIMEIKKSFEISVNRIKTHLDDPDILKNLKKINQEISNLMKAQRTEDDFVRLFECIDRYFYQKLTKINPKLTELDLKHCAYIKLNLNNYEISDLLFVERKSIQMTRYRIRKKLNLQKNQSLRQFIMQL